MSGIMTGKRVTLVYPTLEYQDEFIQKAQQSVALHTPWINPPKESEAYQEYLYRYNFEEYAGFLITLTENNALVGVININVIVMGAFCSGYLGYYCFEGYQHQGLMSEGLQLVINYAFTELKLHRLEANVQTANKDSIAFIKHNGFRHEGFSPNYLFIDGAWRDHERFALTSEDLDEQ